MRRHILGVVAATVAAPYLVMLLGSPLDSERGLAALWSGIQQATGGLVLFGIPTLILAGICAAILHRLKLQTWVWCMAGGAGVGLVFLGLLTSLTYRHMTKSFWPLLLVVLILLLSGAVCGWIYWRIALKNPPRRDLPRETLSDGSLPRRHEPPALRKVCSALFFNRRAPSWKPCGKPSR